MKTKALTSVLSIAFAALSSNGLAGVEPIDASKSKEMIQPAPACDPRWYLSIGGGLDIDFQATDFVSATDFTLESTTPPVIEPQLELYKSRSYDDVYGNLYRIQGEIGYVLTNHIEIFALLKYAFGYGGHFGGDLDRQPSPPDEHFFPIDTYYGDYRSWGGELGLRYFFCSKETWEPWRFRPYVSLSAGATHVESIQVVARYLSNEFGPVIPAFAGNLYDDSVVGTGALMLGVELPVSCHWAFGVEAGVRYESELDSTDVIRRTITDYDDSREEANSFHYRVGDNAGHYNSDGARLYCPANVYLKFRF